MNKSKLIVLLKNFTKEEMRDFGKFISSLYFSTGRNLMPMYSILKKHYPLFNSPAFSEEKIYKKLYSSKKYEGKRSLHAVHVLFSELTLLAEKFLVYNSFENGKRDFYRDSNLLYFLMERNMYDYALRYSLNLDKRLDKMGKDRYYYYEKIGINEYISSVYTLNFKTEKSFEYKKKDIIYLYAFMCDKICGLINDLVNREVFYNKQSGGLELLKNFVLGFDEEVFKNSCDDDEYNTKSFVIMNYYISKALLNNNDKQSFEKALEYYYKTLDKFSKQNKFVFFAYLNTICNSRVKFDFDYYAITGHKLSDVFLKNKLYKLEDSVKLPANFYGAIINYKFIFLDAEEFKIFIDNTLKDIESTKKDDLYNFSYALFYIKKKNYQKALELISKIKSIIQPLKSRVLQWKIAALYELKLFEDVIGSLDSFEHYTRNNPNVTALNKEHYLNFVRSVKYLVRCQINGIYDKAFINEINNDNRNSTFKFWFLEKTDEILCKNQK